MTTKQKRYNNRELSWLDFNERVLQEAADPTVPLLERLKFLGIFSNNLDEFFRVRVANVKRMLGLGRKAKDSLHLKPQKLLDEIQQRVITLNKTFDKTYENIQTELRRQGVHIIDETKLNATQQNFVRTFFREHVRPALVPIMLNQVHRFPYLKDRSIYFAIKLSVHSKPRQTQFALVEIPTDQVDRFVVLPGSGSRQYVILLDDIIRHNLHELFSIFSFDKIEAYTIKLTRDAELDIDTDVSQSFMEKLSRSVKNRQKGNPVRFVYDEKIPADLLMHIRTKMKLQKYDNLIPGGRYHNFKDFINFPKLGLKKLVYDELKPVPHKAFASKQNTLQAIRERDILLHYPYQPFNHFIELLREAAIDPNVRSIKLTLYRAAKKSLVVNALINAARNGKHVMAIVELQARFDEEANIKWAKALADEGIHVIYGVPGLKVHAKLCLIERQEGNKIISYANISTGNYNEVTSQTYCDDALFTCEPNITAEVNDMFTFFERNYQIKQFKYLIPSPLRTRKKFIALIENEIHNAKKKKPASIFLKLNSLVDEEMIEHLYAASKAGVKIRIIVRGMCVLVPGVAGMSENIEVISIVDKFLEHSRIYVFENGGQPLYYISSADWMTRNLDRRVEISCPILDKKLQAELRDLLELQWSDNVKARNITTNTYRKTTGTKIRAQEKYIEILRKKAG